MKSLKQRLRRQESSAGSADWSKYDERLFKAVETGDVDKVVATLKKGAVATKLDADGNSALHVAATKGLINSLNIFLAHGVNLHTTDSTGKTALHLAVRGGHSACVQRLLQSKSPVDCTDMQGRMALHEAACAGHSTIIKMLCGSGASVSAVDKDGQSPLSLAAKMGHPRACQHLLNCGASTNNRDKQNKTALILACEHRCPEVVEVLLKHKADVMAVDHFGRNAYHYAQLSENQALITMVKQAWDAASKAIETSKATQLLQHQKSMNPEAQTYVRTSSVHSPTKGPSSGLNWSSPGVKKLVKAPSSQHMREHNGRSADGKEDLQSVYLDYSQVRQLSAASGSLGEVELLRRELWEVKRRHEASQEELLRLDVALAQSTRDYEDLRVGSERALQEAHSHAWELEEALAEVQRRMVGSEARVRQMQARLMSVRENLVEELRVQLLEVKAELQQTQEELKQSRFNAEEQQRSHDVLQQEVHRLTEELLSKERDSKEVVVSLATPAPSNDVGLQTPLEWTSASSQSTMTDLTAESLQQQIDKSGYISVKEHEEVRTSLSTSLQQAQEKAQDALLNQQQIEEENQRLLTELREQRVELDVLQEALQARFVPVSQLEEKETELAELRLALRQIKENEESGKSITETPLLQEQKKEASGDVRLSESRPTPSSEEPQCLEMLEESERSTSTTQNMSSCSPEALNKDSETVLRAENHTASHWNSSAPSSHCSLFHADCSTMQEHVNSLQQQLENSERRFRQILEVYRSRLLSAAQGFMDEEARVALLQIAQMRQECVC